jgi:phosphopantothenoylcysteine decarboxylase / phosphopantothenate---cysteine ligase
LDAPNGVTLHQVESAREMLAVCEAALPADIFVGVAAVADWRPAEVADHKLKLKGQRVAPSLDLTENPDILSTMAGLGANRPKLVIGFAAETEHVAHYAQAKLARKGCDWIVANDVSGDVMGGESNQVTLITKSGLENWSLASKSEVARQLVVRICSVMQEA